MSADFDIFVLILNYQAVIGSVGIDATGLASLYGRCLVVTLGGFLCWRSKLRSSFPACYGLEVEHTHFYSPKGILPCFAVAVTMGQVVEYYSQ